MCNGKCYCEVCELCNMTFAEQKEYCDEQYRQQKNQVESDYLKRNSLSVEQMRNKQDLEIERYYQYFLSIGETPDQSKKSADVEYLMNL